MSVSCSSVLYSSARASRRFPATRALTSSSSTSAGSAMVSCTSATASHPEHPAPGWPVRFGYPHERNRVGPVMDVGTSRERARRGDGMAGETTKPTTTDAGTPVPSDEYSLTVGPDGPILLQDHYLI